MEGVTPKLSYGLSSKACFSPSSFLDQGTVSTKGVLGFLHKAARPLSICTYTRGDTAVSSAAAAAAVDHLDEDGAGTEVNEGLSEINRRSSGTCRRDSSSLVRPLRS